jgi:DNA-binding winged helix-turn-helix (wHTH) protein/tetratricopeptide (TPR) repeat protein
MVSKMLETILALGKAHYSLVDQQLCNANGQEIPLRPQTMKVLDFFVRSNGVLQSKDALLQAVWKGLAVTDGSLVQCIREIRLAIEDENHSILQTVHKRGYRLNAAPFQVKPSRVGNELRIGSERKHSSASDSAAATDVTSNRHDEFLALPLALAVLPFNSREEDEQSKRLAKIFAGDLLTALTLHPELPLISRQASFALRGQIHSASEISLKLQARYVVTGQVQVNEGNLHWLLEVLDGATNQVLWAENQSAHFTNVPMEREALLKRLAAKIQNCFIASRDKLSQAVDENSSDPFHQFVNAMQIMLRYTPECAIESERLCALLVAQHPAYPRGLSGHATSLLLDMSHCYTGRRIENCAEEVLAELNKSIGLDRGYGFSYSLLAHALCYNGNFEEAQVALRKAHDLAPGHAMQLAHRAHVYFFSGQLDLVLSCAEESMAVDVESAYSGFGVPSRGRALVFQNNLVQGIDDLTKFLVLTPGYNWARMALIVALEELGEHSKAAHHYTQLLKYTRNFDRTFFGRLWRAIPDIRDRYIKALGAHGMS